MKNKPRIKRTIVKWQIEDQGANPLTSRGRKWIKKEIEKFRKSASKQLKLRNELEKQSFDNADASEAYWNWVDNYGGRESAQANPDLMRDDLDNTVD